MSGDIKYMDIKIFRLFCCITSYIVYIYLDDRIIAYDAKRKHNKEKGYRCCYDFDRGDMCFGIKLCMRVNKGVENGC